MILSRKWLNEFVDVSDISDREFDEAMTLSGSKVETVTALDESLKNVVVGKILSMEKHPDSDHMWICQITWDRRSLPRSSPAHGISMWAIWCPWPSTSPCSPTARKSKRASSGAWCPTGCCAL